MGKQVALNQINVSDEITLLTDSTGVPTTAVIAATSGHVIWYQRDENTAVVTDAGSAADMSAITDAHTDWEFKHVQAGGYRVDLPDAAFLEGASIVRWGMYATGISGITREIIINPLFKFNGTAGSVTATTTTFPAGTTPYAGDEIVAVDGTGIKQTRLVLSVAGEVATHLAWDINISSSTTTILLLAGDSHQVFLDASVASRSTLDSGDLTSETAEITSDIADVQTAVDAILIDTSTTLEASIAAVKGDTAAILIDTGTTLDGKVDAVKVDTAAILVDTGTTLDAAVAAVKSDTAAILIDTSTTLEASIAAVKGDTAAVLIDTADMQPKLGSPASDVSADVAAVKVVVDGIKGTTDNFGFSSSSNVQVDVQEINDQEVFGAGTAGNKWRGSA